MITLPQLISHRFRGFAPYENTLEGMLAALDFGVQNLEFDIRVARCGTPMIYHDEYAYDANGRRHFLCDVMAVDFVALGGDFGRMPTADVLFEAAARHKNNTAKLLIDIKDAGFEAEINALVHLHRLQDRAIYVSWLPEVLYHLHDMSPHIPLCFSHWSKSPSEKIRDAHHVFNAQNGHVPAPTASQSAQASHGIRSGWFVDGPVKGTLRDNLKNSKGAICVPENMIDQALVDDYHKDNIAVSTFAYTDWDKLNDHHKYFNIDLYFIDKKEIFESL